MEGHWICVMDLYSKTSYNSKFLFHHETVSKLIIFTNFSSSPPLSLQLIGVLTSSCSSEVPASIFCHNEISYLQNISVDFFLRPHREHYYYHVNIFPAWCPLSYQHAVQKVDWSLVGLADTTDAALDSTPLTVMWAWPFYWQYHGVLPFLLVPVSSETSLKASVIYYCPFWVTWDGFL